MTVIDKNTVLHIAKLAHLNLSETEVNYYQKHLATIIDYVDRLSQLEVEDHGDPSAPLTGSRGPLPQDDVRPQTYGTGRHPEAQLKDRNEVHEAQPKDLIHTEDEKTVRDVVGTPERSDQVGPSLKTEEIFGSAPKKSGTSFEVPRIFEA